ncbi:MAG: hypothetical protein VB130_15660 [Clostridium sp.]|nr:hypothetical protein [Clostridium sp.]
MNNKIEDLKNKYDALEIPAELDEYIKKGIEKGKSEMRKKKIRTRWTKGAASVAAAAVVFTIGINTMPVFASSMSNVPGIGKLVKVLQFNKGIGLGGTITDGSDVKSITSQKNNASETLTINFSKDNASSDTVPHYKVDYKKYPYTMIFTVSGARNISAEKEFEALKQNKFVSDVYKIITLDDSMVRFNVVFNTPVKFEVKEYKEPAQMVINLTKDKETLQQPIYAVRSASYPNGEQIGSIEEQFSSDGARILKDEKGTFLVDMGAFNSENIAKEKIVELNKKYSNNTKFYIEKRNATDIPKAIKEANQANSQAVENNPASAATEFSAVLLNNDEEGMIKLNSKNISFYPTGSKNSMFSFEYKDINLVK